MRAGNIEKSPFCRSQGPPSTENHGKAGSVTRIITLALNAKMRNFAQRLQRPAMPCAQNGSVKAEQKGEESMRDLDSGRRFRALNCGVSLCALAAMGFVTAAEAQTAGTAADSPAQQASAASADDAT